MDNLLFCKIIATLMVLEPDSELVKVVVEFAQRSGSDDFEACWDDPATAEKLKKAWKELSEWDDSHPQKIEIIAGSMNQYFQFKQ